MILIADSGSTKTDWCLEEDGHIILRLETQGINPFHQDVDEIQRILLDELLPGLGDFDIEMVTFYGSGCRAEKIEPMLNLLSEVFTHSEVEVNGDLLAAARAVCGRNEGIACILGTGSNSCLYDGSKVVKNTPPLGYILGDEGSGAVLGALFINALYKGMLPISLREAFHQETGLQLSDIIRKVYSEPLANRFLASLSGFIHRHLDVRQLNEMVVNNFRAFFHLNVSQYQHRELAVGAIGSVAFYYRRQLVQASILEGYSVTKVMKSPMEGLVKFHH